jgi:DNA-binding CsgD family transcriptional regulator
MPALTAVRAAAGESQAAPQAIPAFFRQAEVDSAARELASAFDVERVSEDVTDDIMVSVWPQIDDAGYRAAVHASVRDNVRSITEIIAGRLDIDAAEPQGALDFAEVTAQLDVPLSEIERAYRVGIASVWSHWFALARQHAEDAGVALPDLLGGPTMTIFAFADHVLASVIPRFEAIRGDLHHTRRHLRRMTLMQVLDGTIDEPSEDLDRSLDYCLADTHLALLVDTARGRPPEKEIAQLRAAADARSVLELQHGPHSWIVWLGRPAGFGPTQLTRLRRALGNVEFTVAVGEPGAGIAGLRRTRLQALETTRVQRALGVEGHRCLWAREVRLESLLLNDEDRARRFVADELGRLASNDTLAQRLRETLLAWLATGSHVSAAAILGVHENTVRNRIRHAEERLGTSLFQRRTELQVALRLERVLRARDGGEAEKSERAG